jgi:hypothetical protein
VQHHCWVGTPNTYAEPTHRRTAISASDSTNVCVWCFLSLSCDRNSDDAGNLVCSARDQSLMAALLTAASAYRNPSGRAAACRPTRRCCRTAAGTEDAPAFRRHRRAAGDGHQGRSPWPPPHEQREMGIYKAANAQVRTLTLIRGAATTSASARWRAATADGKR